MNLLVLTSFRECACPLDKFLEVELAGKRNDAFSVLRNTAKGPLWRLYPSLFASAVPKRACFPHTPPTRCVMFFKLH